MDTKLALSILASMVMGVAYIPYFRDIFRRVTKPHAYTWLIWTITQIVAMAGLRHGGGGWAFWSLLFTTILVFAVFLLSFKYGTRNITRGDTIILSLATLAVFVWWQMESPVLAVLMVSLIDGLGYWPSIRKTYEDPWTETPSSWAMFTISNLLAISSLAEFNFLTIAYLATITAANILVFSLCVAKRKIVPRANPI